MCIFKNTKQQVVKNMKKRDIQANEPELNLVTSGPVQSGFLPSTIFNRDQDRS